MPGTGAIDYSVFGVFARHQNYQVVTLLYADDHAVAYNSANNNMYTSGTAPTPILGDTNFYRGADNKTAVVTVPYFYW